MNTALIKPQWSPITLILMVAGFMVFWPLGLLVLAYILWGERFGGSSQRAERWVNKQKERAGRCGRRYGFSGDGFARHGFSSGNAAFDAYREDQLKRLDEERRRLDEEIDEFHEHMRNLRMARDREEFDHFMAQRKNARADNGDHGEN